MVDLTAGIVFARAFDHVAVANARAGAAWQFAEHIIAERAPPQRRHEGRGLARLDLPRDGKVARSLGEIVDRSEDLTVVRAADRINTCHRGSYNGAARQCKVRSGAIPGFARIQAQARRAR